MRQFVSKNMKQKPNQVKNKMKKGIISLLTKKKFIDITVSDVIRESDVSRASFYRVYKNIDQILDEIVDDINNSYMNEILPVLEEKDEIKIKKLIVEFFNSFKSKNTLLLDMLPSNSTLLLSKLEQNTVYVVPSSSNNMYEKYTPTLVLAVIFTILKLWEKDNFKDSTIDVAEFTYSTIVKVNEKQQ